LYYSPSNIATIKSRRTSWVRYAACMSGNRCAYNKRLVEPEVMRLFGGPKCRYEDNIKVILKKQGVWMWSAVIWLGIGTSGGLL
jgi:hypothetical protein